MDETGVLWVPAVSGLVFVAIGLAAYRGVAKPFLLSLWPSTTLAFGLLWGGLASVLTGLGWSVLHHPVGALLLGVPILAGWALLLASFVWLPRGLQPAWYRERSLAR